MKVGKADGHLPQGIGVPRPPGSDRSRTAIASLGPQYGPLIIDLGRHRGLSRDLGIDHAGQRAPMVVTAGEHLADQSLVPVVESPLMTDPATGLRMSGVADLRRILAGLDPEQDVPEAVEFTMFTEQVAATE